MRSCLRRRRLLRPVLLLLVFAFRFGLESSLEAVIASSRLALVPLVDTLLVSMLFDIVFPVVIVVHCGFGLPLRFAFVVASVAAAICFYGGRLWFLAF